MHDFSLNHEVPAPITNNSTIAAIAPSQIVYMLMLVRMYVYVNVRVRVYEEARGITLGSILNSTHFETGSLIGLDLTN